MASAARQTVSTMAVKIADGGTKGASFLVRSLSGSTYYWGASGVTSTTGQPIAVGEDLSLSLGAGDSVWAICGAGQSAVLSIGTIGGA